ncbi:MAG: hypothetical protein VYA60_10065 [Pseudomonadota bacterium]|nr:hypothetical protein [Pseudomonadota bacterium]
MILEETDKLYLYDSYEDAYLIDKESSDILFTDSFYGAIWELTVSNKSLFKISDFIKYKNLLYTDNIVW